ncbi:MAG: hypothetical protein LPL29_00890 [Alphaproteobacteria bacterium]|nr:hypothetical protein [Alphaproteobacteria bacterium]
MVLGFKTEYKGDKAIDWVEMAPAGEGFERTHTWHRIKDIKPPEHANPDSLSHRDMIERWKVVGPKYQAYKDGLEIPEDGTPLAAWSGVTPDQAKALRAMGISTVEAVSEMSESATTKLPFSGARRLPALAKEFLDGRGKAEAQAEIEAMREKMAAMEEMLGEYMAKEKRGPGRPKKQEVDAA